MGTVYKPVDNCAGNFVDVNYGDKYRNSVLIIQGYFIANYKVFTMN